MSNPPDVVIPGGKPALFDTFSRHVPTWLRDASPTEQQAWRAALGASLAASAAAEQLLARLVAPLEFVEDLLVKALRERFNRPIDLRHAQLWQFQRTRELDRETPLRLNGKAQIARVRVDIDQRTLLEVALGSFSAAQTVPGSFEADSAVLAAAASGPRQSYSEGPWYEASDLLGIAPYEFAQVCRQADPGQRYQEHLQTVLLGAAPAAILQANARDDIRLQAESARLRGLLSPTACQMVLDMLAGPASWEGHPVQVCELRLLRSLTRPGIALARGLLLQAQLSGRPGCVLYLPGEPNHPLCEFASLDACAVYLREQLRQPDYRQYFTRLVGLAERADFSSRLRNALEPLPFWSVNPGDDERREDPDADLVLRASAQPGHALLGWLQERQVAGILADARQLVVPCDDEDRKVHQARLALWESIGMNVFNLAGFFVPGLDVLLIGATAAQLLGDLVIGIDQWRHSERTEALAHFDNVLQTLAVAAVAAGAGAVVRRSPMMEGLLPVVDGHGAGRLLKAPLEAFASDRRLPAEVLADAAGLYRIDSQHYIRIDDKLYATTYDAGFKRWLITHPDPACSYKVALQHNQQGAWRAASERVADWTDEQLMRRLGHSADGLDTLTLDRLQRTARMSRAGLLRLHREGLPIPAVLREALADAQAQRALEGSPAGQDFAALRRPVVLRDVAGTAVITRDFAGLPGSLAEEIAAAATSRERQVLDQGRVPLRLAEQARLALRDWRLAQALDGLWLAQAERADSTALVQQLGPHVPGPAPQEPAALRAAVYRYALEHRGEAAVALGQQRVQPWLRPPARTANGLLGYPLSGRGAASWLPVPTVEERLRDLYPDVHEVHFQQLLAELGDDAEAGVQRLEAQYQTLRTELDQWIAEPGEWMDEHAVLHSVDAEARVGVALEIRAAWRRETGLIIAGYGEQPASDLDLSERHVGVLPSLSVDFPHVQSLALNDMGLHGDISGFLQRFTRVTALEMQGNALTRLPSGLASLGELRGLSADANPLQTSEQMFESLSNLHSLNFLVLGEHPIAPPVEAFRSLAGLTRLREIGMPGAGAVFSLEHWQVLAGLPVLERLWLGNNQLVLTPPIVEAIAGMRSLQLLDLHDNPLGLAPDVSQLHQLQTLDLRACNLIRLPPGLIELMAMANGPLRSVWLRNNSIVELPPLAHLPFFRRLLRVFDVSISNLEAASVQRLNLARGIAPRSDGLAPPVAVAPMAPGPDWLQGATARTLQNVQALRDLPQAEYFLEALDRAEDMATYQRDAVTGRARAQALVQAIVEPLPGDDGQGLTALRQTFFDIGEEAITTCGDGIQLLLSRCETQLLVYRESATADSLAPILALGRRVLRAALVDEAAGELVRGREAQRDAAARVPPAADPDAALSALDEPELALQPLATDEVEICLRLRLDLAVPLDLPPQPERMLYEVRTSAAQLERVQAQVLARLTDERLANWLVEQPWWRQLLARRSPESLATAEQPWLDAQQYLYELSSDAPELRPLAAPVLARLSELYPDRTWEVNGASQRVQLDSDEQDTVRQCLVAGQQQARDQALGRLTREEIERDATA